MKRIGLAAALAALAFAAFAQPPPGTGPGPGPGQGPGPRGFRAGPDSVPGWSLMTPEERKAHQERMASMKTRAECTSAMEEHHKLMAERAREKGAALKWNGPAGRGCSRLPG